MKNISWIFLILIITGCGGGGNDETTDVKTSPIVRTWITDACEQAKNTSGELIQNWGKGIYEFKSTGELEFSFRSYKNSTCTGDFEILQNENLFSLKYENLGSELLEEGIVGEKINIIFPKIKDEKNIAEGFYVIANGSLCFSDRLNLNGYGLSWSEAEFSKIDYEKCLSILN